MNFSFYRPFCYLLLTSSLLSARTFEDTKGRKIEASVTALEGDKVTLKLDKTGKSYEIALEHYLLRIKNLLQNGLKVISQARMTRSLNFLIPQSLNQTLMLNGLI